MEIYDTIEERDVFTTNDAVLGMPRSDSIGIQAVVLSDRREPGIQVPEAVI